MMIELERIALNKSVKVGVLENNIIHWKSGVLVGRTLEAMPRYDIRLPDGSIQADVPAEFVKGAA